MKKIEFTLVHPQLSLAAEFPSPAINNLPEWYKNTPSHINNKKQMINGQFNETIKKCMPVLDSINSGYVIKLWTDIYVERDLNGMNFNHSMVTSNVKVVDGHNIHQAHLYPFQEGYERQVLKWINPWHIKTPKGYSCLFVTPLHHDLPFKLFEAVVDTDVFPLTINFPFMIRNGFSGTIKHGTPIVQVIPFKRENYDAVEGKFDQQKYERLTNLHDNMFENKYKTKWWSRKRFT